MKGAVAELIDSGLFTLASNPWNTGKLASYARQYKFKVKKQVVVKRTPPWSRSRGYLKSASEAQLYVIKEFIGKIKQRLNNDRLAKLPASVAIQELMPGTKAPEGLKAPRRRALTAQELDRRIAKIEQIMSDKEKQRARETAVAMVMEAGVERERAIGG